MCKDRKERICKNGERVQGRDTDKEPWSPPMIFVRADLTGTKTFVMKYKGTTRTITEHFLYCRKAKEDV